MMHQDTRKPGVFDGLIVALLIALAAGVASLLFGGFFAQALLIGVVLHAAALAYLVYLLQRARARVGKLITLTAWALLTAVNWLLPIPLFEQILLLAAFIWLVRSLYFHASLISAALDFGLVSVGLAAAAWAAVNTGSLAAALWSFFLLQALFCWIPQAAGQAKPVRTDADLNAASFHAAHRVALDAVRKLSTP